MPPKKKNNKKKQKKKLSASSSAASLPVAADPLPLTQLPDQPPSQSVAPDQPVKSPVQKVELLRQLSPPELDNDPTMHDDVDPEVVVNETSNTKSDLTANHSPTTDYQIVDSKPVPIEPKINHSLLSQQASKLQSLPDQDIAQVVPKNLPLPVNEQKLSKSFASAGSKSPSNSLYGSIPKSIPRRASQAMKGGTPSSLGLKGATPTSLFQAAHRKSLAGSDSDIDDLLGAQEVNDIVSGHLVADKSDKSEQISASFGSVSHSLVGGSVTRDIYKWQENRQSQEGTRARRNSDPQITVVPVSPTGPSIGDIREPGGFRRHFIRTKARAEGKRPNILTSNFIDFLVLYGYYGGDVCPSDDEDNEDDADLLPGTGHDDEENALETQPLMRNSTHNAIEGTSESKAFFMLLKAFVGTGVLFLPKAFYNGGISFSIVTMLVLGFLTQHCMLLLVECSRALGGKSFGDIANHLYGNNMRTVILGSIAISQMGFCCAYFIFVGQNLRDILMIASNCELILPDWFFILIQLLLYIPLAWVRKIKHFGITSLIADVFILVGLGYIFSFDVVKLAQEGFQPVPAFNPTQFPLFIGTAMFAFEGICLILPIADSMKQPERFSRVVNVGMFVIGGIFVTVGALSYLALGQKVETIVFLNLPKSPVVTGIQFFYAIAIMLSFPLTLYPAIKITETVIFGHSTGKGSNLIKWEKNLYRASLTSTLGLVAWAGSTNLDKVVSLVGCFACIPLSFIYPSLFHIAIAPSPWVRAKDWGLVVFGTLATLYTTYVTIEQWALTGPEIPLDRCHDGFRI